MVNKLKEIAQYLTLHANQTNNLGLLHGKMGIVIFFYHYSSFTKDKLYSRFAGDLLDDIYEEITTIYPLDFKDGLSGIAWGMEYLIRNKFVGGDPDELLENLDKRIIERDVRKITDTSLEKGLLGLGHYIIARYLPNQKISPVISMDYVYELFISLVNNNSGSGELNEIAEVIKNILEGRPVLFEPDKLLQTILPVKRVNPDKLIGKQYPLGIKNGYAGIGLQLIRS